MLWKRHVGISGAAAIALALAVAGCGASKQHGESLASNTADPCQVYLHGQDTRVKIEYGGGEAGCREVASQWSSTPGLEWTAGQPPAPQRPLKLICAMRARTGLTLTVQDSHPGYGNELCQNMASKGFKSVGAGSSTTSTSTLQFGSG
jgi:hypothetical protein